MDAYEQINKKKGCSYLPYSLAKINPCGPGLLEAPAQKNASLALPSNVKSEIKSVYSFTANTSPPT